MWEHYRQQRRKDSNIGISTGSSRSTECTEHTCRDIRRGEGSSQGREQRCWRQARPGTCKEFSQPKGQWGRRLPTLIKAQPWALDWSLRHFIFFLENLNTKRLMLAKHQRDEWQPFYPWQLASWSFYLSGDPPNEESSNVIHGDVSTAKERGLKPFYLQKFIYIHFTDLK